MTFNFSLRSSTEKFTRKSWKVTTNDEDNLKGVIDQGLEGNKIKWKQNSETILKDGFPLVYTKTSLWATGKSHTLHL